MASLGDFYRLSHVCDCGSGLGSGWFKDEKLRSVKACDKCKPKLLSRIFEDRFLDLFEGWLGGLLLDASVDGYEWAWGDLLKERGCEQVVGLEAAKQGRKPGQLLISCPNGDYIYPHHSSDKSVHILVPKEYADIVLECGRMI